MLIPFRTSFRDRGKSKNVHFSFSFCEKAIVGIFPLASFPFTRLEGGRDVSSFPGRKKRIANFFREKKCFPRKYIKQFLFFPPFQPKYKLQKNRPSFLAVTISMTHSSRGKMDPKTNLSLPSSPSMYISRFLGSPHLEAKQRNSLFWGQHNDPVRFWDREEERGPPPQSRCRWRRSLNLWFPGSEEKEEEKVYSMGQLG